VKTSRMRTDDEGCSINDNASGTSGGMNAWTCVCVCVCVCVVVVVVCTKEGVAALDVE